MDKKLMNPAAAIFVAFRKSHTRPKWHILVQDKPENAGD